MKSFSFALLPGSLLLIIAPTFAQAPPERQPPPDGGTREVLVSILIPSIPNAPFSATLSTESVRMLADGGRITLVNHRAIARDGAGRIFQERRLLAPPDGEHESVITQTEISDPVRMSFLSAKPMNTSAKWSLILLPFLRELPAPSNQPREAAAKIWASSSSAVWKLRVLERRQSWNRG